MGNFHSNPCDTDAGCYGDPDTVYKDAGSMDRKPTAPDVRGFVKPQSSLGLQRAQKNQFNTAQMGGRPPPTSHF